MGDFNTLDSGDFFLETDLQHDTPQISSQDNSGKVTLFMVVGGFL